MPLRRPAIGFRAATAAAVVALAGPLLAAPGSAAPPAAYAPRAAAEDGDVVPLQVTGPPEDRLNLVVLGDGYTAAQQADFREDVDKHLNILWSLEPFRGYRDYFNVYLVEVHSAESGVSCDPDHGNVRRDTALDLQYAATCPADPNARGVTFGAGGQQALEAYVSAIPGVTPSNRQTLTIANTDTYGGIGGRNATTTADNALSPYITPHELGHSLGELQDEYPYYERGVAGDPWTGGEPDSVHHSTLTRTEMREQRAKWWRWLGEPSESGGRIGRFESGLYSCCDIWRPSKHSLMRWLGYRFDQVSREKMVEKISGRRDEAQLAVRSTPGETVGWRDVLWVDVPHPTYHRLDVVWRINGRVVRDARGATDLDLAGRGVRRGDTVRVRVSDPTPWVRDPAVSEGPTMTATRSWTVGARTAAEDPEPGFTRSTATDRPVGAQDVVHVQTTHHPDRVLDVRWRLDGRRLRAADGERTLDLGARDLARGTHRLEAVLRDPAGSGVVARRSWRVDATPPTVTPRLSRPESRRDGVRTYRGWFTMGLETFDDQDGYVVPEFRLDGDGWHQYYGWTDSPEGSPFLFTPRGTVIKQLVYGALSPGGMSWAPFEEREPGYGRHTVEYRAIDAAGNVGPTRSFTVRVLRGGTEPPQRLARP